MFTLADMQELLRQRPFVPFRLRMSGGDQIDIRSPELVFPGRRYATVGLLDPNSNDTVYDRTTLVFYMHVTGVERLGAGPLPGSPPPTQSDSPAPIAS